MTLHYAGPKPLISAHGIKFDPNKEDKFIYFGFVVELIKALDHEYLEDKPYVATVTYSSHDAHNIFSLMQKYDPLLNETITERENTIQSEIDDEIKRAEENCLLCEEDRDVLIKNLELLRNYRIPRSINKTVYYSGITTLAKIIHDRKISYIKAPILRIHSHVFHSIQGVLRKLHPPMDSNLEIIEEGGHLHVRLQMNSF
ncbi:hypothetical protein [Sulfuricurvum sp.]|uniref:hypothetical protein n=1 Tax=Sulfuricurvum sp. TaxID=2025608 RepID=UPI003C51ECC9